MLLQYHEFGLAQLVQWAGSHTLQERCEASWKAHVLQGHSVRWRHVCAGYEINKDTTNIHKKEAVKVLLAIVASETTDPKKLSVQLQHTNRPVS
jgi:hypothetical protein